MVNNLWETLFLPGYDELFTAHISKGIVTGCYPTPYNQEMRWLLISTFLRNKKRDCILRQSLLHLFYMLLMYPMHFSHKALIQRKHYQSGNDRDEREYEEKYRN